MNKLKDVDGKIFYGENHGGVFAVWEDDKKKKNIANYGNAYVAQEKGRYTFLDDDGKAFEVEKPPEEQPTAEGGIKQDTVPENKAATHPANRPSVEKPNAPPPVKAAPAAGAASQPQGDQGSSTPGSDAQPAPATPATP